MPEHNVFPVDDEPRQVWTTQEKLKESMPLKLRKAVDGILERNRAGLLEEFEAFSETAQARNIIEAGGLLGRVAEFVAAQRGF